jgi:2-polyprenyl-6-methoxyphenol hydroxylase-like FAD-dependent oxidoreductase
MNIAILGAGVAGVSSAILLKQRGFEVTVYERHAAPSNIGAGIVVWPNAAYVLEQIGVLHEIKAVSGYPSSMHMLSRDNENLGSIDIEQINAQMGYPSLSISPQRFSTYPLIQTCFFGGCD